jgi:integrase
MLMDVYICIYTFVFTDLKRKRDSLLRDFSLKKGSIPGYKGAWERFQEFYKEMYGREASFPVPVEAVSLYLTNLGIQVKSSSVINTASAAITFEHEVRGFQTPCTKPMITRLKKAIKRRNAETKVSMARRPFSDEEGDRIREICTSRKRCHDDKWGRLLALFSLTEAMGLRIGEARTLRVGDIDLSVAQKPTQRGVFLKDSKADRFSTGTTRGALVRDDGGRGQRAF